MLNRLDSDPICQNAFIELASVQDLESIEKLNKQLYLDIPDFKWDKKEWILEEVRKGNFFLFRQNGLVCGAICLIPNEGEPIIETIAVDREEQRKGIGKRLIEFAFEKVRKGNIAKIQTGSFACYGAKDFYLKCGFRLESSKTDALGVSYYRFIANV
jgi:GNAT superfamily N-acetyltransferase